MIYAPALLGTIWGWVSPPFSSCRIYCGWRRTSCCQRSHGTLGKGPAANRNQRVVQTSAIPFNKPRSYLPEHKAGTRGNGQGAANTHSDNRVVVRERLCGIHRPHMWRAWTKGSCSTVTSWGRFAQPSNTTHTHTQKKQLLATYVTCWWRVCGCCDLSDTLLGNRPRIPVWGATWWNWAGGGKTNERLSRGERKVGQMPQIKCQLLASQPTFVWRKPGCFCVIMLPRCRSA